MNDKSTYTHSSATTYQWKYDHAHPERGLLIDISDPDLRAEIEFWQAVSADAQKVIEPFERPAEPRGYLSGTELAAALFFLALGLMLIASLYIARVR